MKDKKKVAVVLFNLGGPDSLDAVRGFLFNMFSDKAIIRLPNPFRWVIAVLISVLRRKKSQNLYKLIGGKSPLLNETQAQSLAIEDRLNNLSGAKNLYQVFVSMRYWHPRVRGVISEIVKFNPDEIILLPLYPQFSTTTTGSSFDEFFLRIKNTPIENKVTKSVCCYFSNKKFVSAYAKLIKNTLKKTKGDSFILFCAHSLPTSIIKSGDPYQSQVEMCAIEISKKLNLSNYSVCYQSKVGRLEWIGPDINSEIKRLAKQTKNLVVVPISFVSENLETLVDLDIECKKVALDAGVKNFLRVPTPGNDPEFIDALVDICCDFVGNGVKSKHGCISNIGLKCFKCISKHHSF